jgi:hypothetical protein
MPVISGGPRILHYRMKLAFLARYEDAKGAPKRTYKHSKISKFFRGYDPRNPVSKGEGRVGRGWVGLGWEGIGVWPTQKLSRGAPYEKRSLIVFNKWTAVFAKFSFLVNMYIILQSSDLVVYNILFSVYTQLLVFSDFHRKFYESR